MMRPLHGPPYIFMKKTLFHPFFVATSLCFLCTCSGPSTLMAQEQGGATLGVNLENIFRLDNVESRSISPENFTGEKGRAGMATNGTGKGASRELGQGWKRSEERRV